MIKLVIVRQIMTGIVEDLMMKMDPNKINIAAPDWPVLCVSKNRKSDSIPIAKDNTTPVARFLSCACLPAISTPIEERILKIKNPHKVLTPSRKDIAAPAPPKSEIA